MPLYMVTRCVASCVLSSNAPKSLIAASGRFPSWRICGPMNSCFAYDWQLREGSQISAGRVDFAGGSAVLPTLSEGLKIEHSDFETENATLKDIHSCQVVEIVIGGVPTVLEIRLMSMCMSLGWILLLGSVLRNMFDAVRHQVDLWNVEVGIQLRRNIYLVADIIPPGVHFTPLLGLSPAFSICFLVYHALLHKVRSLGIGFCLRILAGSPE